MPTRFIWKILAFQLGCYACGEPVADVGKLYSSVAFLKHIKRAKKSRRTESELKGLTN